MTASRSTQYRPPFAIKPTATARAAAGVSLAALTMLAATPAIASDACKVLLCLAAPSWRDIPECVPPVRRVLRDLALGKPFPVCDMSSAGNGASHDWAAAPGFCPPQYTFTLELESGTRPECLYDGAITVRVDGQRFTRTWWSKSGDAVTDFSPVAKSRLGSWDPRFDREYASWLDAPPASAPVQP